jgi:beta-lactamase class A
MVGVGKRYFFLLFFFITSTAVLAFFLYQERADNGFVLSANTNCKYEHLNPLRCEPGLARQKKEYVALRNELLAFIEEEKKKNQVTHVSVYFRDLQNGPTMSIDSSENFAPASLLKVPLMITYYKKAENDPALLEKKLQIVGDVSSLPQNIKPSNSVEFGKIYNRDELLHYLITQSDNTAWEALLNDLRQNYSEEDFVVTLSDLGIIDPGAKGDQYITVQSYASIFRILYNSSYLSIPMSEKALEVLSQSAFIDGIVAGVPEGTKVAHKFGERKNGDEQQLHDCGIVYYPENPYLLCIMTKGKNISELLTVIQHVSKEVHKEVKERSLQE